MKTKRTISNISYNTPAYFEAKVQDWLERGVIDWAYWIVHQPDIDERKEHIHFVLQPSQRVDTTDLRNDLKEPDIEAGKPRTCTMKWMPVASGHMDDWLLYAVHNEYYLASKGQKRNISYTNEDICSTDADALRQDLGAIDMLKYMRLQWLYDAVKDGTPFVTLVQQGYVPIAMRAQYEHQYNDLQRLFVNDESGRIVDHETGEILDEAKTVTAPQQTVRGTDEPKQIEGFTPAEDIPF